MVTGIWVRWAGSKVVPGKVRPGDVKLFWDGGKILGQKCSFGEVAVIYK